MVPMIMSARCEGDGHHCGPSAVGQVVGRRDMVPLFGQGQVYAQYMKNMASPEIVHED